MHNQVVIIGGGPSGTLLCPFTYKGGCFGMEHSRHVNEKWSREKNEC